MREVSGRSGRRRGSQKPGIATDGWTVGALFCPSTGPDGAKAAESRTKPETGPVIQELIGLSRRIVIWVRNRGLRCWLARGAYKPNRRSGSEITPQIGCRVLGPPLQTERRDELTVLVHQVDDGGVIHRVVAVLERHFLVVDAISLRDRGERICIAADADQVRIEAREIFFQCLRRVAFRIDRDEQRVELVGIRPELA